MPAAVRAGVDVHACGALDIVGSLDVFINGHPAHRLKDLDNHGGSMVEGSPNVFVNGLPKVRVGDHHGGDLLHPPSPEATGSPNVFVNG